MIVLLGTKSGFRISEKWILDRTGLKHASYITARTALVNKGWLEHDPAKGITINIDAIKNSSNTILQKESSSNIILPQCSNTILQQRGNMILPITNKTDNKINKEKFIPEEKGTIQNPHIVSKEWLIERHNELTSLANGLFRYGNEFYKMEVLPQ